MDTIFGSKVKMEQVFIAGVRFPATRVKAGPCVVTQIKNMDTDGYWAIQVGFGEKRIKNVTKPMQGHLKNTILDAKASSFLAEIKLDSEPSYKVGDKINLSDVVSEGDTITVTGVSKGKGFAGVVKRWGFAGGPATHGQSDRQRAPGSIGQGTTPGRVLKGKHMAGRMGNETKSIKNLKVLKIDAEKGEILVLGPIPGRIGGVVEIKRTSEMKEKPQVVEAEAEAPVEEIVAEPIVETEEPKEEVKAEAEVTEVKEEEQNA